MRLPPNRKLLAEVKGNNRYLVETGSYRGDAIQEALDAGYDFIRSMDIDSRNIKFCMNRFDLYRKSDPRIKLYEGDSAGCLWKMIDPIAEPITFWLDAHSQYLEDEPEFGDNPFPLLDELFQIGEHQIKNHTILIDDILILTHPKVTCWSLDDIISALRRINSSYQLQLVANPVKNNLLIAKL